MFYLYSISNYRNDKLPYVKDELACKRYASHYSGLAPASGAGGFARTAYL